MNKKIILVSLMLITLIYIPTISNAALQANGKSFKIDTLEKWLLNIRKMEATGGTLGLSDTINENDLTSSASNSNNLDIHMELNTEYGAMAILSASSYGNPNKINDGETTTGNKSGIYIYSNSKEATSAALENLSLNIFNKANLKYKNIYNIGPFVPKIGDATIETAGWHGAREADTSLNSSRYFLRYTGVFGYRCYENNSSGANLDGSYITRAVVVVGEGL